jgi:prepilin-type processing-associated H-X9-DG protein
MEDTDHAYGYDMTVNGAIVVHYVDDHRGKIVKLTGSADGTAPSSGQTPGSPGGQTVSIDSDGNYTVGNIPGLASGVALKPSNYGLNKGTYDVANLNITKPDAKLIFILDHHELVVDAFVDFDKYFIDTSTPNGLTNWISGWGKDGADWREYQSLRHFSQANVLFCDGHIESLGYERLEPYTIPETGAPPNRVIWK